MKRLLLFSSAMFLSLSVSAYPIAGTQPDKRPESAPIIKEYDKSAIWYQNALHGLQQPYPASFHFLENQGGWYTPFNHRGMTGPYDIRNWY